MKVRLQRNGYQRYLTVISGIGWVFVERASNPNCYACNTWSARTANHVIEHGFTLRDLRQKLNAIASSSEATK